MTSRKILASLAPILLCLIAVPASAAVQEFPNNCCNDGATGDCGMGQDGAKEYALALANYYQSVWEYPSTDLMQISGEQHGCSSGCSCTISQLRIWNFEYDHLSLTEPYVQFKRTVTWTNCGIAA